MAVPLIPALSVQSSDLIWSRAFNFWKPDYKVTWINCKHFKEWPEEWEDLKSDPIKDGGRNCKYLIQRRIDVREIWHWIQAYSVLWKWILIFLNNPLDQWLEAERRYFFSRTKILKFQCIWKSVVLSKRSELTISGEKFKHWVDDLSPGVLWRMLKH